MFTFTKHQLLLLFSAFLSVMHIPFVASQSFIFIIISVLFSFILNYFILSIFRFNKIIFKIWISLILLLSSIAIFYIYADRIIFSRYLIFTILAGSRDEVFSNIHYKMLFSIIIIWLLPTLALIKIKIKQTSKKQKLSKKLFPLWLFMLFLFLTLIQTKSFIAIVIKHKANLVCYDVFESILEAGISKGVKKILNKKYQIKPLTEIYNFEYKKEKEDKIVFLIIGESARAKNFNNLGYEVNTTPKLNTLSDLYKAEALACATLTLKSVPCMLSLQTSKHFSLNTAEGFVVDVFNSLGFKTILFSTNDIRETDALISNIYKSFDKYHNLRYNFDEVIYPQLDSYLKQKGDKLIVLHSAGSHFHYRDRYPKEFEIFKPICQGSVYNCTSEEVINTYNNSILYTDQIIFDIIKKLKNKNAILFYVSDHGQSLGEYKIYKHGIPIFFAPDEQKYVPFFVWKSKKYNKQFIKEGKNEISHDFISHSLLDCANIKSDSINNNLSVCK